MNRLLCLIACFLVASKVPVFSAPVHGKKGGASTEANPAVKQATVKSSPNIAPPDTPLTEQQIELELKSRVSHGRVIPWVCDAEVWRHRGTRGGIGGAPYKPPRYVRGDVTVEKVKDSLYYRASMPVTEEDNEGNKKTFDHIEIWCVDPAHHKFTKMRNRNYYRDFSGNPPRYIEFE